MFNTQADTTQPRLRWLTGTVWEQKQSHRSTYSQNVQTTYTVHTVQVTKAVPSSVCIRHISTSNLNKQTPLSLLTVMCLSVQGDKHLKTGHDRLLPNFYSTEGNEPENLTQLVPQPYQKAKIELVRPC